MIQKIKEKYLQKRLVRNHPQKELDNEKPEKDKKEKNPCAD
jgi:hypothetical protein